MTHDIPDVAEAPPAGFARRILLTFTAPGTLGDSLRVRPVWAAAAVLGCMLVVAATAAIPADVWAEFLRTQTLSRGGDPAMTAPPTNVIRIFSTVGAAISWFVFLFLLSGIVTFIFAFVLGDEGRYGQYLASLAHANLIGAVGALLVAPLKIAERNPQLTLSVGTFLEGFLRDGFLLFWFRAMDLFAIWSWVVLGVLVSRIDGRRSAGSAVGILLGILLVLLSVVAWFQARSLS